MPSVLSPKSSGSATDPGDDQAARFTESFARRPTLPRRGLLPGARVWATTVGVVALAVAGVLIVPLLARIDLFSESPATSVRTVAGATPDAAATAPGSPVPSARAGRQPAGQLPRSAAAGTVGGGSGGSGSGGVGLPAAGTGGGTGTGTGTSGAQSGTGTKEQPSGTVHSGGTKTTASATPGGSSGGGSGGGTGTVPGTALVGNASQRCIDVTDANDGKGKDGTPLQIWNCNGRANQKWEFASDGTLRALGLCMDVAWGSHENGAVIQLANCHDSGAQQFRLSAAGDLVNPQADKCVDVVDEGTGAGTRLQLWTCNGQSNQKWHKG
ncbi:ricin-type beta-trefoil lectin domain protein [Streptomyces sp. NPDC088354]|uniref:RICIN domain-containing protein n=1 Tax=unclassified Streptomyces TaxID=2593676 RepID=UPI0029B858D6|nr:RICIN domain-containing protein [Streptomyces sp. MI02-7b]MDX3076791.1 RICIN domain-containing protein [Streptomyces sp. MI02-7b]